MRDMETAADIIARIGLAVPPGSPLPFQESAQSELRTLTRRLIESYLRDGRASSDPFADTRTRTIHCYEGEIHDLLRGKAVLVTGGAGCVGRALIAALPRYDPLKVICVDWAASGPPGATHDRVDIRDRSSLSRVFNLERPDVVFHLAAQRDPGLAERRVHETITTNVFGTSNVILACEETGVKVCVYSSTGKASRYLTQEVYAASKKLAEWQLADANQSGRTKYVLARFTHMLDNSLVRGQLDGWIAAGQPVGVHAPGRLVVAQNSTEAVQLLLNCTIRASSGPIRMSVVRNLGWPVETLELALYLIRQSGRDIPVYFLGCPRGYWEEFFRGQVDWRDPMDLHPLLNVLESPARQLDTSGTSIWTELEEFDSNTLYRHLAQLNDATMLSDGTTLPEASDGAMRSALSAASHAMCASALKAAPASEVLNILHWGVGPKCVERGSCRTAFPSLVETLTGALSGRLTENTIRESVLSTKDYEELVRSLEADGKPVETWPRRVVPAAGLRAEPEVRLSLR
jgi:nucleoside-diphosphate-sugar epimerase